MGEAQLIGLPEAEGPAASALMPGTILLHGQYRIERFLNAGGFGITYQAKDSLDRDVVIKECFPEAFCRRTNLTVQPRSPAHQSELRSVVQAFVQEARATARLHHPNIVRVHQVFAENDTAYMALDFVDGFDLQQVLEDPDRQLEPQQINSILRGVLKAIAFTHRAGILHRDIAPDNILIDRKLRPVLIDFGAAREMSRTEGPRHAALRAVKDGYSPQEFYISGSEQTPSSDLYSLGATFYHLIAKEAPPNSQKRLAAIASGKQDVYVPLVARVDGYDRTFLEAIDKALEILPKNRLQSATDWLTRIDPAPEAASTVTALRTAVAMAARPMPSTAKPDRSRILVFVAMAAAMALIGAGLAYQSGLLGRSTKVGLAVSVLGSSEPAHLRAAVLDPGILLDFALKGESVFATRGFEPHRWQNQTKRPHHRLGSAIAMVTKG